MKQMPIKPEFIHLGEIDCSEYIALNTNPLVRHQTPLTSEKFDEEMEIAGEHFIRYRLYAPKIQER
jgi:hypothetical protein